MTRSQKAKAVLDGMMPVIRALRVECPVCSQPESFVDVKWELLSENPELWRGACGHWFTRDDGYHVRQS